MTMHAFMHLLGVVCLMSMAGTAVLVIWRSVAPQWRRIWPLARGNPEPFPPAASVVLDPHRPRRPQLRAVEADAELTQGSEA